MSAQRERLARLGTAPADVLVAGILFALTMLECALASSVQHPWVDLVWLVPLTLAIAWLRTRTALATTVVYVAALGMTFTGDSVVDFTSIFISVMLVALATGLWLELRQAILALAGLIAVVVIVNLAGTGETGDYVFPPAIFATWWTLGRFLRARHLLTEELRERTARLELERDELALAAADEERARVARELHDVVAHSMSVMVVQSGAARRVLDRSPEEAIDALRTVEATGRQTLEELRRLLGVLRPAGQDADLAPAPHTRDLLALVARARATGLKVDLRMSGDLGSLPATTNLTVYRIVQEALTNALRHAGETHASVNVRRSAHNVVIDVRDSGPPMSAGRARVPRSAYARSAAPGGLKVAGDGFGLVGMRERVELLGGELDAGPAPGGGFRVYVRIPLDAADEPSPVEQEPVSP